MLKMQRGLKKKLIQMVAIEIISLIVLGSFLMYMQTTMSVHNQQTDLMEKLKQIEEIVAAREEYALNAIDSYDQVMTAKALSVAYMARTEPGFEYTNQRMRELSELMELRNVLILNAGGEKLAWAEDNQQLYPSSFLASRYNQLRTCFNTGEVSKPFNVDINEVTLRYYGAPIDENTMVVAVWEPDTVNITLDKLTSLKSELGEISVGLEGYAFAISRLDYNFSYHPKAELNGMDALDAGVDVADLLDGNMCWMTIGGERLYCAVKLIGDEYIVCAVTAKEINSSRNTTVVATLLAFFVVVTVVIAYAFLYREDVLMKGGEPREEYAKLGGLYFDKRVERKILSIAVMGLVLILGISLYMQTLFALSRQSMSNTRRLKALGQTIDDNYEEIARLRGLFDARNLGKCHMLAYMLEHNGELANKQTLSELAALNGIKWIYVMDQNGESIATNSPYWDFALSEDPESRTFAFRGVLKGYTDSLVQEAAYDDFAGETLQYVGFAIKDEAGSPEGMVLIAMELTQLNEMMQSTRVDTVLGAVRVGVNGFAFAVKKRDLTFTYYPDERLTGRSAKDYGMTDFALRDEFCDYITVDGERYYAASLETVDTLIYLAVPDKELNRYRLPVALLTAAASLICLALIALGLITTRHPDFERPIPEPTNEDSPALNVVLPDGRVKHTMTAASRWTGVMWNKKTPEQKMFSVLGILMGIIAVLLLTAIAAGDRIFDENSIIHYILGDEWEHSLNIFAITSSLIVCVTVFMISALGRKLLMWFARNFDARGETVCRLLDSLIKYGTIIGVLYYCLSLVGVDTPTLVASAGILSLVVGLGSQSLISDILAGLFIVFEGEFRVGDIVTIDDWRGTVLEIGVRTTKIDGMGNIKIISNRNVSGVINMTKQFSFATCTVGVEHGESLERVESILYEELPRIKKRLPAIVEGPFYKGVVELGASSVDISLMAKCAENDRVQLTRDLNRELKLIFDKHGVKIPFPQIAVNTPSPFDEATALEKREAAVFVKEQKIATQTLRDNQEK